MDSNSCVEGFLDNLADAIGKELDANTIAIMGPFFGNLDYTLRNVVESIEPDRKKARAAIVLDTTGGVVELVERMVQILRHHFSEVQFIIPNYAMSAGTVFAMSGDAIWMDYFSCLGPIDPQIERDGKLIPALSYVVQYQELVEKSRQGTLTDAELILLSKLDLADIHTFQQARELSIQLLEDWLSTYKFKDWTETGTRKMPVTEQMRKDRAVEIAIALSDNTHWKSHGRPISMRHLTEGLNLRINDLSSNKGLQQSVRLYFDLLQDYTSKVGKFQIIHTTGACL